MRLPWRPRAPRRPPREPVTLDNYYEAEKITSDDPAWEIFGRVMETGRAVMGTRDENGNWTIEDLPDEP